MTGRHAIYIRFDDGYLPFARACLNSLRTNYPDHPAVLADYQGDDPGAVALLERMGAVRLPHEPPPEFAAHLRCPRGADAVFDRFKLWRAPFRGYETLLHLDADTLVLAPLDDLFRQPTPHFVANHEGTRGARIFGAARPDRPTLRRRLDEDGLAAVFGPDHMVNAGVFTLPRAFRGREALARLSRLARRYGRFLAYADQSLLSLWLAAEGLSPSLDFAFNFQTPMLTDPGVALRFEDIRILHFSSPRKPGTAAFDRWDRVGPMRQRVTELFVRYRDMEP